MQTIQVQFYQVEAQPLQILADSKLFWFLPCRKIVGHAWMFFNYNVYLFIMFITSHQLLMYKGWRLETIPHFLSIVLATKSIFLCMSRRKKNRFIETKIIYTRFNAIISSKIMKKINSNCCWAFSSRELSSYV